MAHFAAMSVYSNKLELVLKWYIDIIGADGKEELRQLLQHTSPVDRYSLLMNVRGDKYGNTGPHIAAREDDLETMKCMLEGFTVDEKYDVLKIQARNGLSALHLAASFGNSLIITNLLTDLSQQQKYNLLQLQKKDGDTPLHRAALQQKPEAVQAILTSLSPQQQIQLLNLKNEKEQTVSGIRPEVYKEHPLLVIQGMKTKMH